MKPKNQKSKVKMICLLAAVFCILCSIVYAVGTTRISGTAGPAINLNAYLSGDLAELSVPVKVDNLSWEYGTGANAVNVVYADTVTVADGANTTISLYDSGTYLDVFNRALTMESLKFLYIYNSSADANCLAFGGAASDLPVVSDTSDIVSIPPGGSFLWVNPSATGTDITTNKNLYIEHDGTGSSTMDVDIIAMGLD